MANGGEIPAWAQGLLALLGSAPIVAGVSWWVKTRRSDRIADKLADVTEIKNLRQQIFDMQQERIRDEITRRESADKTMQVLAELRAEITRAKLLQHDGRPPA